MVKQTASSSTYLGPALEELSRGGWLGLRDVGVLGLVGLRVIEAVALTRRPALRNYDERQ